MAKKRLSKYSPNPDQPVATLRDGTTITIGDEVTTNFHPSCVGNIFVVEQITPFAECESRSMVLVHLKGNPERKLKGFEKAGYVKTMPDGLDSNWFVKTLKT